MHQGTKRKTVLVVEDDEILATTIKEILEDELDIQGVAVGNAMHALEIVSSMTISLILLDYILPGINGLEFFNMLQETEVTKDIPVLFMTGERGRFLRDTPGIAGYIAKPFDIDDITTPVARLLGEP